jgi:hypothetical protein
VVQYNKQILIDAIVHAVNEDYVEMAGDFCRLGFLAPGTDITPIVPALEAIWQNSTGKGLADFNFRTVTGVLLSKNAFLSGSCFVAQMVCHVVPAGKRSGRTVPARGYMFKAEAGRLLLKIRLFLLSYFSARVQRFSDVSTIQKLQ